MLIRFDKQNNYLGMETSRQEEDSSIRSQSKFSPQQSVVQGPNIDVTTSLNDDASARHGHKQFNVFFKANGSDNSIAEQSDFNAGGKQRSSKAGSNVKRSTFSNGLLSVSKETGGGGQGKKASS